MKVPNKMFIRRKPFLKFTTRLHNKINILNMNFSFTDI